MNKLFSTSNNFFSSAIFSGVMLCSGFVVAQANAATEDPYQVVQQTTEQVLAIVKEAKGYAQKEPERFHKEVTTVLDKVVDFDHFARGVMGSYASAQRYKALTSDAEKAAFNDRIQRFSSTFKKGLIDTYANGLLNFNGQKIETLPLRKGDNLASGAVSIVQNIYNDTGKPYVIQYSMRRTKVGEWKLQNLIIEGINLGLTYRSQFAESADLNKGDLDKVIANWKVEPKVASEIKAEASAATSNVVSSASAVKKTDKQ
ncbi:MAG: ABC transporter substrate-binding protein [Pseudomonadota bacterium]